MAVAVRTLQNFIGGSWVDATGGGVRAVVSPVTGEKLAEAPDASADDVARAARAARAAQPGWEALSVFERAEVMHGIADVLEERRRSSPARSRSRTASRSRPRRSTT